VQATGHRPSGGFAFMQKRTLAARRPRRRALPLTRDAASGCSQPCRRKPAPSFSRARLHASCPGGRTHSLLSLAVVIGGGGAGHARQPGRASVGCADARAENSTRPDGVRARTFSAAPGGPVSPCLALRRTLTGAGGPECGHARAGRRRSVHVGRVRPLCGALARVIPPPPPPPAPRAQLRALALTRAVVALPSQPPTPLPPTGERAGDEVRQAMAHTTS
jgi:hypothetical protein